jgi:hypothetical protein
MSEPRWDTLFGGDPAQVERGVGQALHAARHVSMDDAAYGKICAFLPSLIRDIEQQAYDALAAGNNGVTEIATNVRHTADEYERRDDDHAVRFGSLR